MVEESAKDIINKNFDSNGIKVAYQPIVDANNKKVVGLEALLRLKYTNNKYNIEDIIQEAEKDTSVINKITEHVVFNVVSDHQYFVDRELLTNNSYISINISPIQLTEEFIFLVNNSIKNKIQYSKILFEVTETSNLSFENIKILNILIKMGIKVAMDDFGTGYSSLFDFINIPYNVVKLDKSLIGSISENTVINKIVKDFSIITKNTNINVICEGIESKEHEKILINHGYHYFQGYLYSKPQEKEDLVINKDDIFKKP